jgi:hypothetical protein
MESVVPGLSLTSAIGEDVWLAEEVTREDGTLVETGRPERVQGLVFSITYRDFFQGLEHASAGTDRERLCCVVLQLMSDVQDLVSEITTEPWPLALVNGRKDMAMADATIEGDDLLMWYGERSAPALRLPPVRLV